MSSRVPDKLVQDAVAACATGLSYGKWKALQGNNVAERSVPAAKAGKCCAWCGTQIPEDTRGIYCGPDCAKKRHAEKCRLAYHQKKKDAAGGERSDHNEQETA